MEVAFTCLPNFAVLPQHGKLMTPDEKKEDYRTFLYTKRRRNTLGHRIRNQSVIWSKYRVPVETPRTQCGLVMFLPIIAITSQISISVLSVQSIAINQL